MSSVKRGLAAAMIVGVLGSAAVNGLAPKDATVEQRRHQIEQRAEKDLAEAEKITDRRRRKAMIDSINARLAEQLGSAEMRPKERLPKVLRP